MFPLAACRPKGPANLEAHLLGNVIGVGEATWTSDGGASNLVSQSFIASVGILTNIRIRCSGACTLKAAIYSDNSGIPDALLAYSDSITAVSGWNTIQLRTTCQLVAGTTYWIAFLCSGNYVRRKGDGNTKYKALAYDQPFPATFPAPSSSASDWAIAGWGSPA